MAEQWTGAPAGDVGLRRGEHVPPPSRGEHDGLRSEPDRPVPRSHGRRPPTTTTRGRGGYAALLLLGLPLLGGGVDEALGPGVGLAFQICVVFGAGAAAALVGRAGWWWVVPAGPPVVLATTAVAELVGNSDKYQGSKDLATGAARWAINGFPVMLTALCTALAVVLVRIRRDKGTGRG